MTDQVVVYTRDEAAKVLKIGTRSIDRLLADRKLSYSKVGGQVRITPENIVAYLARVQVKADAELMGEVKLIELNRQQTRRFG